MPKFTSTFTVTVETEISQDLLDAVAKPEWQRDLYKLPTPQAVADHLAYNFVRNRASLPLLDGFADRDERDASMVSERWDRE
jgi:hypothetical protein